MAAPEVGDDAPPFELPGTGGRTYGLEECRDRGLILAFYPADDTVVCTKQFCAYRDDEDRLAGLGVPLFGISPQDVESHDRFVAKHGLTVPLLADVDLAVAKAYGVVGGPFGAYRRSVFVIDRDAVVSYRHISPVVGLTFHTAEDLERAVAALA